MTRVERERARAERRRAMASTASYVACARAVANPRATATEREEAEKYLANAAGGDAREARRCALELLEASTSDAPGDRLSSVERQTCGVIAANALAVGWKSMEAEARTACRGGVLRALFGRDADDDRGVMRAFVNCVDVLAQCACMEREDGWEWDELATALGAGATSERARGREATARVYGALCESLGARVAAKHEDILRVFMHMLSDVDLHVKLAALDGIAKLASSWCLARTLGPTLSECASMLVTGADNALKVGDEKILSSILDAMTALTGVRDEVYGAHSAALIHILEVALRAATNAAFDACSIRAPALLVLTKMAKTHTELLSDTMAGQIDLQYDPHVLGQGGPIAAALVPPLLTIALEADDSDAADEDIEGEGLDEQSSSPAALARAALRALSSSLPNHFVVAPALNLLERLRGSPSAPASWRVFAAITEGTQGDGVSSHLPSLVPELTEILKSDDVRLRAAATEGICAIAAHCQPEMADAYADTMFALIAGMLHHSPRSCQWTVHGALSNMCANAVGESIDPVLPSLVEALKVQLMDHSWRTAARATASFGAVAQCALDYFTPFSSDILSLLLARAQSAERIPHGTELQARSVAAMATILGVIGIEAAPPGLLELLLQTAASSLTSNDTIARECAHECLGKLAVALEEKFEQFAVDAASAAVTTLTASEATPTFKTAVTTGAVEEQIAAAEALGQYFNSGVVCIRPFLPQTLEALAAASDASRPVPLRLAAIRAIEFIFTPWTNAEKEDSNFLALCVATFTVLCECVKSDSDAATVLAAVQSISELLDKAKSLATLPNSVLESTKDAAEMVIRWQTVCQIEYEAKEEAAENDDDGYESDDIFDSMVFWAERIAPQDDDSD